MYRWLITAASSLGVGLLPGPTGTYGSFLTGLLAAAWLWWRPLPLAGWGYLVFLVLLAAAAVAASELSLRAGVYGEGRKDPGQIVIDEAAGQMIAFYGLAGPGWGMFLAFVLFRFFDVFKPFPVDASQKLPGGWGVVVDDLLAGLYALGALRLIQWLTGWAS